MQQGKKHLGTLLVGSFFVLFAFSAAFYASCKKDKCKSLSCQHNDTCQNGACSCPTGYSGTLCEKDDAAKFVGRWETDTIVNMTNYTYTSIINAGQHPGEVSIPIAFVLDSCTTDTSIMCIVKGDSLWSEPLNLYDHCANKWFFYRTGGLHDGKLTIYSYDPWNALVGSITYDRKVY